MHLDWQVIVTVIIVAAAVWHVGRLMAAQIAGFRKSAKPGASGCAGCSEGSKKPATQPLITLSAASPRRIATPKGEEARRADR